MVEALFAADVDVDVAVAAAVAAVAVLVLERVCVGSWGEVC